MNGNRSLPSALSRLHVSATAPQAVVLDAHILHSLVEEPNHLLFTSCLCDCVRKTTMLTLVGLLTTLLDDPLLGSLTYKRCLDSTCLLRASLFFWRENFS